jgi:DtxR family Mn-dependent transcriptional regulator
MARKRRKQQRRGPSRSHGTPSTSQEDYLETIYHLQGERGAVLVSDIAERLGVQRPPATRAVQALRKMGLVEHEARQEVRLTDLGRSTAAALAHRHADLYAFLTDVLGVPPEAAEADTCQMEHGISPLTAQKLHEFLEHWSALDEAARESVRAGRASAAFRYLPEGKGAGWRA